MFKPKGPSCQSCGMPINKDPLGGGTSVDGNKTTEYCSHCFRNGAFTEPNLTCEEMITKVKTKMKEMRIPGFVAYLFTKDIPKLKRWASQS